MIPCITKPTRITKSNATLIDNIFVPLSLVSNVSSYIIIEDMSDHLPILMKLRGYQIVRKEKLVIKSRDLRPNNVRQLKNVFKNYDWHTFLTSVIPQNDQNKNVIPQNVYVNDMFNSFHSKALELIDEFVPFKTRTISSKKFRKEPWLTNGLNNSLLKCKRLYKLSIQKTSTIGEQDHYKQYRNYLNRLKRHAKVTYYQQLSLSLKNNTKKLWEIINNTIGKSSNKSCILEKLKLGNIVYESACDIANNFGSYFATVGTKFANAIDLPKIKISDYLTKIKRNTKSLFLKPTTSIEISNLIGSLPNKSSSGFDQINNKLPKGISEEISTPLEIIFNLSLSMGIFPDAMKMAEVIPLYKGKCRMEPGNYRPISLLLTISKILEKILYKRTYDFLNDNNELYHSQYGFRSKHSCENAISDLISQVLKNQQQNKYIAALFLDLSKAFDTLNHDLLRQKLEIYGVRGIALDWFRSYLNGRKMRLKCQTSETKSQTYSEWYQMTHGTPQGSCLRPLLFLIFCNDLRLNLEYMSCIQFADDTTLFYADKNLDVIKCCVEYDLKLIMDWFRANSLTLNIQKTKYLLFAPRNGKKTL